MRSEEDIRNLRDQYKEQIAFLHKQREDFGVSLGLNGGGISVAPEVPLLKLLETDVRRLNWILGEETHYPGSTYRYENIGVSFEEVCEKTWIRNYNKSYDYCPTHGTFEKGDFCFQCAVGYKDQVVVKVLPPLTEGVS